MSNPTQEENLAERTRDEEGHEGTNEPELDLPGPPNQSLKFTSKRPWPPCKETDTFWHSAQDTPPPPSFTPGS